MGPNTRYGTAPNIFSGGVRGGTPPGKIRLGGLGAQRLVEIECVIVARNNRRNIVRQAVQSIH